VGLGAEVAERALQAPSRVPQRPQEEARNSWRGKGRTGLKRWSQTTNLDVSQVTLVCSPSSSSSIWVMTSSSAKEISFCH
jgi:hypothetical protein